MLKERLETEWVLFELDRGILSIIYKQGLQITLEIAKEIVEDRLRFTKEMEFPGLLEDRGMKGINRKARQYLSSRNGVKGVKAAAFLASSEFNRFLGNFFIKVTVIKPPVPTKLFTNRKKAIEWLEQFK